MIKSEALSAWVNDAPRQKATGAANAALARRWRDHSLFKDLEADLAAMEVRTVTGSLAAADRFMARTGEIEELIAEMVAGAAADPFFHPPFGYANSAINVGFLLYSDPSLSIGLGVTSIDALAAKKSAGEGPSSINFTGLVSSFRWLKAGGATLSFWEAPAADADFTGDRSRKCRLAGRRRLADGECFVMDGRRESFVVEHATSDLVCLQATIGTDCAPLLVEYDSRTLGYVGAASTDEASSRVEMMVTLLRLMDRADAAPHIVALLDSPHFYTRWHIMRELLALDAEAALPHLRQMAKADPHPEVRQAAAQTLDMFFDRQEEAA